MAEIVNLRQARKRREREEASRLAQENRTRFGLSKPQKAAAGSERSKILAVLDGARLDTPATRAEPDPERDDA